MVLKKVLIILAIALVSLATFGIILISHNNSTMRLVSPVFNNNGHIPAQYTCDGEGLSPQLLISDVPESAGSLALIVDDPDAPNGTFTHWTVWNIGPQISTINGGLPPDAIQGKNSAGEIGYIAPCPPNGVHHYVFKLYALSRVLDLPGGASRADLEKALDGKVLATAQLVGLYSREKQQAL